MTGCEKLSGRQSHFEAWGALLIVDCWLCRWRRFLPLAALWWESVEGGREATREWRDSTQVLGDIHHKKQALDCATSLHKNPFLFQQQSVAKLWFHVVGVKFSDQTKWMYIKEWDNIAVYILKICPKFWDTKIHLVQQGACVGWVVWQKRPAICCVWKYIEVGMRGYTLHLKILWGGGM